MAKKDKKMNMSCSSSGGAVYGLGGIGALVYLLQNASGVQEIIFAILKAIVWPAFLIYRVYEVLGL